MCPCILKYVSVRRYASGDISFQCSLQYLVNVYQKNVSIYNIYIYSIERKYVNEVGYFLRGEEDIFCC